MATLPYIGSPDQDPFHTTNKGKYDKDKVYTNATDGRGHGEDIRVKVPQGQPAQIAEIVRQCPEFRNQADFVRNAIVHAMHLWGERMKDREVGDYVDRLVRLEDIKRLEAQVEENEDYLSKAKQVFDGAINRKDARTLSIAIDRAEEALEVLEEPWRTDLQAHIKWAKSQLDSIT